MTNHKYYFKVFSILLKIFGGLSIIFGFFMIVGFPGIGRYQRPTFSWAGILIGIVSLLMGIYLIQA